MRIITRVELGLRAPRRPPLRIPTPTRTWLHHTAGPGTDAAAVRAVQAWHMDGRGWSDIAYPVLVGDGQVYEGRGALVDHLTADPIGSFVLCLMGNRHTHPVPRADIDAAAWLLAHALLSGWTTSPILGGHRDIPGTPWTACPGDHGIAAIPAINTGAERIIRSLTALEDPTMFIARRPDNHYELTDGFARRPFRDWSEMIKYRDKLGLRVIDLSHAEFDQIRPR
ncbi:N-acetylmuramoyl-L-alanine amidase [Mycolicibacterium sp.]|uniref:N-acetylmuramoyl-L-alanine amidase n=1 Tax=Mycolicibacterium sp. TaxID=2320850 RepID=UPI00355D5504